MQPVIGIFAFEFPFGVGKTGEKVDICQVFFPGYLLDSPVDVRYDFPSGDVSGEHVVLRVERQQALYEQLGAGRVLFYLFYDFVYAGGNVFDRLSPRYVVGSYKEEYLCRFALQQGREPVVDSVGHVSADASVFDVLVLEEFGPFCPVGKAVSDEEDVLGGDGEFLEE